MSDPFRHLRTLPRNTRLSSPSRLLFTALFAVIVGLFASPVAETWLLLSFTVVFATAAVVISLRQRRDGLRPNDYAPMRPDSETPRILGGTKSPESPETPDEKRQRYITYAAPVIYFLVIAGGWIPVEIGGWFWAGLVTIAVFSVCWKYFNLVDMVPLNYVPLEEVFATEEDWTPADDAEAVAATLYALQAVPHGRQVRLDVLLDAVRPLGVDGPGFRAALDTLTARGQTVTLRDRKPNDTVLTWVALTGNGRDTVCTGVAAVGARMD